MKPLILASLALILCSACKRHDPDFSFPGRVENIWPLEHWSWSTRDGDGKLKGEALTWLVDEKTFAQLPDGSPLTSNPPVSSEDAVKIASNYASKHPLYKPEYKMAAFGFREIYCIKQGDSSRAFGPSNKWVYYFEFSGGPTSLPIKVYVLFNGTILQPDSKPITE